MDFLCPENNIGRCSRETQVVDVKPRKSLIVLIISVLMLAAAIIYFDTKLLDHVKQTSQQEDNGDKAAANDGTQVTETKEPMEEDTEGREEDVESDVPGSEDGEVRVIASESVPVSYNTPEYDIEVELCENNDMKTYIRLKYYKDGAARKAMRSKTAQRSRRQSHRKTGRIRSGRRCSIPYTANCT
jgi:hypothetical protein